MKKNEVLKVDKIDNHRKPNRHKKFKTIFNRMEFPRDKGEINNNPSLTVPDQTMTIPQIIDRYVRGIPITSNVARYEGEDDLLDGINPATLDRVEREEFLNNTREELRSLNDKIKNDEIRKKQKAYEASVKAAEAKKSENNSESGQDSPGDKK